MSDNKERCHALVARYSRYSSFIIDSSTSKHMASMHDSFLALHPYSGPSILMGDDSEIQAKGIGRIDIDDGYFKNVLFVLDLEANILSVCQMNHNVEKKRVTFTLETLKIVEISMNKMVALVFSDHQTRKYKFSHLLPY